MNVRERKTRMTLVDETGSDSGLAALRDKLDRIDESLLDRLRQRIECCVEIGLFKSAHDVPMMQPHRINVVHERAVRYGEAHGISTDFLRAVYDLIIAETCRVEEIVMGTDSDERIG